MRNRNNRLVFIAVSYIPYRLYFSKANLLNFNSYSTNRICAGIFTEMTDSDSIDLGKKLSKFVRKQKIILIKCILKEYIMRSICLGQLANYIRDTKFHLLHRGKMICACKTQHIWMVLDQKKSAASFRLEENSEKMELLSVAYEV